MMSKTSDASYEWNRDNWIRNMNVHQTNAIGTQQNELQHCVLDSENLGFENLENAIMIIQYLIENVRIYRTACH